MNANAAPRMTMGHCFSRFGTFLYETFCVTARQRDEISDLQGEIYRLRRENKELVNLRNELSLQVSEMSAQIECILSDIAWDISEAERKKRAHAERITELREENDALRSDLIFQDYYVKRAARLEEYVREHFTQEVESATSYPFNNKAISDLNRAARASRESYPIAYTVIEDACNALGRFSYPLYCLASEMLNDYEDDRAFEFMQQDRFPLARRTRVMQIMYEAARDDACQWIDQRDAEITASFKAAYAAAKIALGGTETPYC